MYKYCDLRLHLKFKLYMYLYFSRCIFNRRTTKLKGLFEVRSCLNVSNLSANVKNKIYNYPERGFKFSSWRM